jgi:hypothetical protein
LSLSSGFVTGANDLWSRSGCAWLTGRPNGSARFDGNGAAVLADQLGKRILKATTELGSPVALDGPSLLAERSAHTGFSRGGRQSCNRTSELVACDDGYVSLTLSRDVDRDLLPALFETTVSFGDPWEFVRRQCATVSATWLQDRAQLMGLSVSVLGEHAHRDHSGCTRRDSCTQFPGGPSGRAIPLVVDLSSLWAGPLAAHILGLAGLSVVKVESVDRLDGARFGSPSFYDQLHAGHQSVTLPFTAKDGRDHLHTLLSQADVVLTSARPRAFEQLGVDPKQFMRDRPISAWISISAFGADQPNRVGYGDDAAVAAGLVAHDEHGPMYAADAIADPLTGLTAATHVLEALLHRHRIHVDLALADVAATAAVLTETLGDDWDCRDAAPPQRRPLIGTVAALPGQHNEQWGFEP